MFDKLFKKNKYKLSNRLHFITNISDIDLFGTELFVIDAAVCDTTKKLFDYFAHKLDYSDSFFGKNWSAFRDRVFDMGWIKDQIGKDKIAIYIYNIDKLLINETNKDDKRIFCETINEDYIIDENYRRDPVQFPVDIQFYLLENERKFYIENDSLIIWDQREYIKSIPDIINRLNKWIKENPNASEQEVQKNTELIRELELDQKRK